MHESIKRMLADYSPETSRDAVHALREILQEIALLGLWRSKFFEHAAFYGGTALRILYGLERFSEDLDFSLLAPNHDFELSRYLSGLEKEVRAFGFDVRVDKLDKKKETAIQSAFLKTNNRQALLLISTENSMSSDIHAGKLLKIKLEIDTNPPNQFGTESKFLLRPIPFAVRTYSLPDLFAGKIHAILCRKWKNRVKGRDWYDLVWQIANHPKLHLIHLEQRMRQSGHWPGQKTLNEAGFRKLLLQAIDNLSIEQAQKDARPFLKNSAELEIWSHDFFRDIISRIQVV